MSDYVDWFVNRTKQYKRFMQMLAAETPMAMMLIEAPTGMGKTFLIKRMRHAAVEADVPVAHIDFRERRTYDDLWLVRQIRDQLSQQLPEQQFNQLTYTINQMTAADVQQLTETMSQIASVTVNEISGPKVMRVSYRKSALRKEMLEGLLLDDLQTLSFDLGINYESLRGQTLNEKAIALLTYCETRQMMDRLLSVLLDLFPYRSWWDAEISEDVPDDSTLVWENSDEPVVDQLGDLRRVNDDTRSLAYTHINRAFKLSLRQLQTNKRLVLLFDSFEDGPAEVEAWLRETIFFPLFDGQFTNIAIVLAGRSIPDVGQRKPLVGQTGLALFTREHVREYIIDRRQIPEDDIEKVFTYSGGRPGLLAMMADSAQVSEDDDDDW